MSDLLATGQHLEIWCCNPDCRREVRWTAEEAVARLGPRRTFGAAERALSCGRCGARGCEKWIRCRPCPVDAAETRLRERAAREARGLA